MLRYKMRKSSIKIYFQAEGSSGLMMYKTDLYLKTDPELFAIAAEFAGDSNTFYKELSEAWPLLMNADMYSGR